MVHGRSFRLSPSLLLTSCANTPHLAKNRRGWVSAELPTPAGALNPGRHHCRPILFCSAWMELRFWPRFGLKNRANTPYEVKTAGGEFPLSFQPPWWHWSLNRDSQYPRPILFYDSCHELPFRPWFGIEKCCRHPEISRKPERVSFCRGFNPVRSSQTGLLHPKSYFLVS